MYIYLFIYTHFKHVVVPFCIPCLGNLFFFMLTFFIYVVHLGIYSGCLSLGILNPVTRVYLPRLSTL